MKSILATLLVLLSTNLSYGFAFWPVELTPKNVAEHGFTFAITSAPYNKLLRISIKFTKVRPRIQLRPEAGITICDSKDHEIAICSLQSFESQINLLNIKVMQTESRPFSLTYSFVISRELLPNTKFFISEYLMTNNNEKFWFYLSNFIDAEQGAAANP